MYGRSELKIRTGLPSGQTAGRKRGRDSRSGAPRGEGRFDKDCNSALPSRLMFTFSFLRTAGPTDHRCPKSGILPEREFLAPSHIE
jgi:hypothetical protein